MEIYHVQLPNPRDIVLLDFYVENIGSDEFGPVKDAWMRVRGFCIKIVHRIGGDGMGLIKGYHEDGPKDMPFLGHVDVCREFEEGGIYGHSDGVEFTLLQSQPVDVWPRRRLNDVFYCLSDAGRG